MCFQGDCDEYLSKKKKDLKAYKQAFYKDVHNHTYRCMNGGNDQFNIKTRGKNVCINIVECHI